MAEGYETFTLLWAECSIAVSYQANWLNSRYWHIELRCADRLPVTETGYRSYFVPDTSLADEADIKACVLRWMEAAAGTPAWKRHLEDSKQLKLF